MADIDWAGGLSILLPRRSRQRTGTDEVVGGEGIDPAEATAADTAARSSGVHAATSAVRSPESASDESTAAMSPAEEGNDDVGVVAIASIGQGAKESGARRAADSCGTPAHVHPHMQACATPQNIQTLNTRNKPESSALTTLHPKKLKP